MFVLKSGVTHEKRELQNHKTSAVKALSTAIRLVPTIKNKYNALCSNTFVGYNNRRKSQKRQLENDHLKGNRVAKREYFITDSLKGSLKQIPAWPSPCFHWYGYHWQRRFHEDCP